MKIYYNQKLKQLSRDLRNNSTLSEVLLWNELKARKLMGYQFMRQKPVNNFILDFYCSKLKLAIEIDGDSHLGKENYDKLRQSEIEELGIEFLRFNDKDVKKNLNNVLQSIRN
ncbi:MAG: DUF559 domain-containing protein [Bacteroidota bacterium]